MKTEVKQVPLVCHPKMRRTKDMSTSPTSNKVSQHLSDDPGGSSSIRNRKPLVNVLDAIHDNDTPNSNALGYERSGSVNGQCPGGAGS